MLVLHFRHQSASSIGPSPDALSKAFSVLKVDQKDQLVHETSASEEKDMDGARARAAEEDSILVQSTLDGVRSGEYRMPAPHRQALQLTLGGCQFVCNKDDFFVSFTSFLHFLPPELQLFRSVVETNRCSR